MSNTIEEDESDMSNVRSTPRIVEVENDNKENEPEPEDRQDGDEVSAFVQAYISQREIRQIIL